MNDKEQLYLFLRALTRFNPQNGLLDSLFTRILLGCRYYTGGWQWFAFVSPFSPPIFPNSGVNLWWFAVVCGSLQWFVMVCGGLSYSHTLSFHRGAVM